MGHRVWGSPRVQRPVAGLSPRSSRVACCLPGLGQSKKPSEGRGAAVPAQGSVHLSVLHPSPALLLPLRPGVQHRRGHREPAHPRGQQHLHHQDHRGRRCPEGRAPADWGPAARGKPHACRCLCRATAPILNPSTPPSSSPLGSLLGRCCGRALAAGRRAKPMEMGPCWHLPHRKLHCSRGAVSAPALQPAAMSPGPFPLAGE